jgi:hypothetical protein
VPIARARVAAIYSRDILKYHDAIRISNVPRFTNKKLFFKILSWDKVIYGHYRIFLPAFLILDFPNIATS